MGVEEERRQFDCAFEVVVVETLLVCEICQGLEGGVAALFDYSVSDWPAGVFV
jgi:hypothetical protein